MGGCGETYERLPTRSFLTVIFDNIGIMTQVLNDVKRFSTNFYKIVKFHFWSFLSHALKLTYSLLYYQKCRSDSRFDSTSELPLDTAPSMCLQVKYVEKAKSGIPLPFQREPKYPGLCRTIGIHLGIFPFLASG